MAEQQPKLFTRKHLLIIIPALLVGGTWRLFQEYRETGTVETLSLVSSAVALSIGLIIVAVIAWWGNRPEK